MDNENHNNTWNNFTEFVFWRTDAVIAISVLIVILLL